MTPHAFDALWIAVGVSVVVASMALAWWASRHPDPPPGP
jgi:hypothetical protein